MAIKQFRNALDLRCYYFGDSADDRSPYAQTGTLEGTASVASGNLVLDGDSDYLTYPDAASNSLFSRNELTLFAWFNVDTLDATGQVLISKWDTNQKAYDLFINGTNDTISFALTPDGTTTTAITTTETISASTDYFIVAVWDGSIIKIYINGDEKKNGFYSSGIFNSSETIILGSSFTGTLSFFDGTIYQTGIAGKAWTPQQILNLYHLGKDYRIIESNKELLFSENFKAGKVPNDWTTISGTFAVEYDNSLGKYYLECLTNGSLTIPTDDWFGSNFADSQVTIAGTPTVTRNSSDVTLVMTSGDGITDITVRRN